MSKHRFVCPSPTLLPRPAKYNLFSANAPLGWAISTGAKCSINSIADLKASKIGVSRIGSGSYVMGFVLADTQGWLSSSSSSAAKKEEPFEVIPLQTFEKLRGAVNDGTADFFMWEHFTSKRYYDNGEIRRVGEIYMPWSSWMVVAATELLSAPGSGSGTGMAFDPRLEELFEKVNQGMKYFVEHQDEAVEYISTELDYSAEDAREWLKTVEFASNVRGVDLGVIQKTVDVLRKAGVLGEDGMQAQEMIGGQFGAQRPGRVHNVP
jgi:ABC-type nitrate/sulfonate/bicarbonate transport system substrate-binding protein